jgi:flagellar hook protein FlgE
MSFALSAGVTGLQAHQKMLDIAGNNLANVNTTAFKSSRITFSELLSETIKKASQPTATIGGTNPQQMGSGVGIAGISPNMSQGNIVNTGSPLDLAIEGEGYFVVSDGSQNFYTRAGVFAVDAASNLVDPTSGYLVQRIGSVGVSDGFQTGGDSDIHVPYDVAMAAKATTEVKIVGNLSADAQLPTTQTNVLKSNVSYTTNNGTTATETTLIGSLDQYTGTLSSGTITFSGYKPDGTALVETGSSWVDLTMAVGPTTTLQNVLDHLNTNDGIPVRSEVQTITITGGAAGDTFTLSDGTDTTNAIAYDADAATVQAALIADLTSITASDVVCAGTLAAGMTITYADDLANQDVTNLTIVGTFAGGGSAAFEETTKGRDAVRGVLGSGATASITHGKIEITDTVSGFSKSDLAMAWSGDGTLTMPAYFEIPTVGGEEVKSINITVHDSQGGKHVLGGAFVRTKVENIWDMVLTSITGDIYNITFDNRRIEDIGFDAGDGSYSGLTGADDADLEITFAHDTANPQTITVDMGTSGQLNGLTQFAGNSTAVAREQDGYEAGSLSTVSVDSGGTLIGVFSNGIKKNIATLQIALFQNTSALESVGSGYLNFSANSGGAVATQALSGGAGSIHGGSLEKSNADVATEFVNMIQAQNGFQANARTIRVANDILRELTSLIR